MKSIHIAAVAVIGVLLVVTVAIAQRFVSDDSTTAKRDEPAATASDVIRSFSPNLDAQGAAQAEQFGEALEDLRELTETRSMQVTVTVRDEPPLEIWEVDDDSCLMVNTLAPTTIQVRGTSDPPSFATYPVPAVAKRLPSGGCEADLTVAGHESATFDISLVLDGKRTSTQSLTRSSGLEIALVH